MCTDNCTSSRTTTQQCYTTIDQAFQDYQSNTKRVSHKYLLMPNSCHNIKKLYMRHPVATGCPKNVPMCFPISTTWERFLGHPGQLYNIWLTCSDLRVIRTPKALLKKLVRRGLRGAGDSRNAYSLSNKAVSEDNFSLIWQIKYYNQNMMLTLSLVTGHLINITGDHLTGNIGQFKSKSLI